MATRHQNGNPGRFRDAVVGPVLDVGEQDDLALNRRESGQCRQESSAEVGALERSNGRVLVFGRHSLVQRDEPASSNGSQSIQGLAVYDREKPGGELCRLPAGGELLVSVHEGLLGDVVRFGGVAEESEGAREGGAAVAADQYRERVFRSRQRAVYQLFVGQLGGHADNRTPAGDGT